MFWVQVKKEIRLQRSNILFAFAVFLVWCFDFLFLLTGDRNLSSRILTTGKLVQIIHYFFILPCLIVIVPMLIGSTSIAQERKLGTLEWQSTLPVSRRMRWIVKTGTDLVLAFFLGGILSWLCDRILMWNFRIQNLFTIWGDENINPIPFLFKGLFPGYLSLLFFSTGVYISSFSRDSYKAFMGAFGFLWLSSFVKRLIDPAGMLIPLAITFPGFFIHPLSHYFLILLLSAVLLCMGFINFNPAKTKRSIIILQIVSWIFVVNIAGYFTLRWEFNPGRLLEQQKITSPGITKIFGSSDIDRMSPIFRVPNSPILITSVIKEEDEKRYADEDLKGYFPNGHIIEINIQSGEKRIIPGLFGEINEIDTLGKYYTVKQEFGNRQYHVRKPGIVIPAVLDDKFQTIVGSFRRPIFLEELYLFPDAPFRETMIVKKPDGDIFHHEINGYPSQVYGDILVFHISSKQEGKHETCIIGKSNDPNIFQLIDQFSGYRLFPFSHDGRWYADHRVGMPDACYKSGFIENDPSEKEKGVRIISTDSPTSYTISAQGKFVVFSRLFYSSVFRTFIDPLHFPVPDNQSLSISKNGKFLFFIRFPSNLIEFDGVKIPDGFPKEMEFWILDLKNGKEILLDKIEPGVLSHKKREIFLHRKEAFNQKNSGDIAQYNYLQQAKRDFIPTHWNTLSFVVNTWLNEDKLAILFDEKIYLYRYMKTEDRFISIDPVIVNDSFYTEKNLYSNNLEMVFYSDEMLLIFMRDNHSLWKLDLREYFKQM